MQPPVAERFTAFPDSSVTGQIAAATLRTDDHVLVRIGAAAPADAMCNLRRLWFHARTVRGNGLHDGAQRGLAYRQSGRAFFQARRHRTHALDAA